MRPHLAVVLLLALVSPARADGDPLRDAMAAAATAAQAKDWASAETAYREAARLVAELARKQPDNLDLVFTRDGLEYNAACSAALAGAPTRPSTCSVACSGGRGTTTTTCSRTTPRA